MVRPTGLFVLALLVGSAFVACSSFGSEASPKADAGAPAPTDAGSKLEDVGAGSDGAPGEAGATSCPDRQVFCTTFEQGFDGWTPSVAPATGATAELSQARSRSSPSSFRSSVESATGRSLSALLQRSATLPGGRGIWTTWIYIPAPPTLQYVTLLTIQFAGGGGYYFELTEDRKLKGYLYREDYSGEETSVTRVPAPVDRWFKATLRFDHESGSVRLSIDDKDMPTLSYSGWDFGGDPKAAIRFDLGFATEKATPPTEAFFDDSVLELAP